jgi:hypothetical protein
MQTVRAKFTCVSVSDSRPCEVKMVAAPSDPENDRFFRSVPSGEISFSTSNEFVAREFVAGKKYYVDFTPAEDEQWK